MMLTLEKDHTQGQDDALLDIYRKLRPGEPPTREAAQTLLNNYYFNPKRYDLAKVGRYKINRKLGLETDKNKTVLEIKDVLATIEYLVRLHADETEFQGERGLTRVAAVDHLRDQPELAGADRHQLRRHLQHQALDPHLGEVELVGRVALRGLVVSHGPPSSHAGPARSSS